MQTRLGSLVEAMANIAVGFGVNYAGNLLILPMYLAGLDGVIAFKIGLWFTALSLARQFVLRRWFNGLKFGNSHQGVKA